MSATRIIGCCIALAFAVPATAGDTEASEALDRARAEDQLEPVKKGFHGFRVGYTYVNIDGDSALSSPHLFVIGYELTQRALGGDWLNVITVQNVSIAGMNQSLFFPSFNALVGFEIAEQVQIGTGVNLAPLDPDGRWIHMVMAVGYTPSAGAFNVPVHFTYIPDVGGNYRIGLTTGVNW